MTQQKKAVSITQAADEAGVSRMTVHRFLKAGLLQRQPGGGVSKADVLRIAGRGHRQRSRPVAAQVPTWHGHRWQDVMRVMFAAACGSADIDRLAAGIYYLRKEHSVFLDALTSGDTDRPCPTDAFLCAATGRQSFDFAAFTAQQIRRTFLPEHFDAAGRAIADNYGETWKRLARICPDARVDVVPCFVADRPAGKACLCLIPGWLRDKPKGVYRSPSVPGISTSVVKPAALGVGAQRQVIERIATAIFRRYADLATLSPGFVFPPEVNATVNRIRQGAIREAREVLQDSGLSRADADAYCTAWRVLLAGLDDARTDTEYDDKRSIPDNARKGGKQVRARTAVNISTLATVFGVSRLTMRRWLKPSAATRRR